MRLKLKDVYKVKHSHHDKTIPPEETVALFKERCQDADLHILKETRRIDNGRLDIPVYFSVCGHDAHILTGTRKQMGKGVTPELAEASAVMELAERFSLYSFRDTPDHFRTGRLDDIPDALPFSLISRSVAPALSADENRDAEIFGKLELQWVNAFNLTRKEQTKVPLDWFFMINEFNGSSAGNCLEEAVCQGICEVVERHVCARVSRDMPTLPCIDPASVEAPENRELLKKFNQAGIRLFIHDLSLDTGVPTIGVLAFDPTTFPEKSEIVWTAGTAPSPEKALSRALTEVAQLAGDFNTDANYVASGLPKFKSLDDAAPIINPLENGTAEVVALSDLPDLSNPNIKQEIQHLVSRLHTLNLEVLVIDTTDPRLGIPACYTLIPGTEFRERAQAGSIAMFCAKHLYDNHPPQAALTHLETLEKRLPGQYYISFYKGLCHLALDAPDIALACLEAALEASPAPQDVPSIYSYAGICLKEMGRYEAALDLLKKGKALDDDRPDIHNLMGFCHFMLKQNRRSIACFERVLDLTPGSAIDHASIAANYRELGETDKAVAYYEMALALDPDLGYARENLERLKI